MDEPLVSVIIPVYNGDRFLADALDSVFAQTYRPIEVIVVDDGSTDRSGAVAQSRPGVRYVRQENAGVSAARNAAIHISRGELIGLLDADDVWLPEKLRLQVACMVENPECGLVASHNVHFLQQGLDRPSWFPANRIGKEESALIPSTWLVHRTTFDRVGLFDVSFRQSEDVEWLARAKDAGIAARIIEKPLVRKRLHDRNLMGNIAEGQQAMLRALRDSVHRQQGREALPGRGDRG